MQVEALFDAARLLDAEQRKPEWRDVRAIRDSDERATTLAARYDVSETLIRRIRRDEIWVTKRPREAVRLPAVATLVLSGPRVSELCKLDEPGVDLAARRIRMPRVKTDASERTVPMVPALHEILLAASAERETRGGPAFPIRNGTRQSPDNVRSRVLASVRERANELLAEREQLLIGHVTPHTLRRTFASILAEVGVPPRRAMYLLGHTDPTLTMRVYQQVLDMGGRAVEPLERVLGCTIQHRTPGRPWGLHKPRRVRVLQRLGRRLDPSAIRRRFKRAAAGAGLRSLKLHGLRHGAGSLLAREADAVAVQAFLGHSKLTTTERYMHAKARPDDLA